jgi:hypothetical protein
MASDDLNICVEALLHKRVKNLTPITPTTTVKPPAAIKTSMPTLQVVPDSDSNSESSLDEVNSECSDQEVKEVCSSTSVSKRKRTHEQALDTSGSQSSLTKV